MALVVKDRVKETSATTGTGTLTLAGAVVGFQSFSSALSDGDTTYYAIFESSTGEWEVGLGTFTVSGTTLARTTILASSNSGSAVNLTAGAADVFITQPATKAAYFDGSGDLILNQDPTSNLQAATKQYVDTIAAAGLHYHAPVRVQTTANLTATYNNGSSGVGATLTNSGTQAAISIDNVTLSSADRVLVSGQTNAAHNGVYTVTTVGSVSTNWVLTRATDADSYGPSDPDALGEGDAFFIKEGDTNAGHLDVMTTSGTITFGTTNIVFSEVAETTVYSAGNGLTLTGTTFAVGAGTGVTVNANDVAIGQSVGTSATPTFAGLNTTADITFGDNDKAIFGAGSDLQIYHDASNSYIVDGGTGDLKIQGANVRLENPSGVRYFQGSSGNTYLYNSGNIKLTTTSTGIDVTGTVTADGLTLETNNASINFTGTTGNNFINVKQGLRIDIDNDNNQGATSFGITHGGGTGNVFNASENGDISFYEDTGTTAKFFWDASAESLGIGTTTPAAELHIVESGGTPEIRLSDGTHAAMFKMDTVAHIGSVTSVGLAFDINSTEEMRLTSTGLGIGTSSPSAPLTVQTSATTNVEIKTSAINGTAQLRFSNDARIYSLGINNNDSFFVYDATGTSTRMIIDSNGNVGIGTTSPTHTISLESAYPYISFNETDQSQKWVIGGATGNFVIYDDTDAATRLAVDGSGNVGIGTTSPNQNLQVKSVSGGGLTLQADTATQNEYSQLGFVPSTNDAANPNAYIRGLRGSTSTATFLTFGTSNLERMRIDASGSLLVGKTTNDSNVVGAQLNANGTVIGTADGVRPAIFNRKTSDGDIISLRKDGTTVGSIGTQGGLLNIGNGDCGLAFSTNNDNIYPTNPSTSTNRDAAIDLGGGTVRFKDLYLSGSLSDGTTSRTVADIVGLTSSQFLRSDQADTIDGNLTIGGTSHIAMQEDHYVNRRFEVDTPSATSVVYILLCRNAANNDVNGTITMDRTSGLRFACSWDIIVSSGSSTTPIGSLTGHSLAGAGQPSARLVTLTYSSLSYVALELTNPDLYYETTGAYFNGRIVNSGSNTFTVVTAGQVSAISSMSISTSRTIMSNNLEVGNSIYVPNEIYHEGDTDTYIAFGTDTITLTAGGSAEVTVNTTGVRLGDSGNGYFQPVSGNYGSIQIDGGAHGGWEGYSIGGRAVFMHDNSTSMGLYDDVNNHWAVNHTFNGATQLYYDGTSKLQTTSTGASVTGVFTADSVAEDYDALSGTTPTCNIDNAGAFSLTMTGNTTFTFSGADSGYSNGFILQLTGNATTAYTVTWPTSVDWAGGTAPDAPAVGETDIYVFWTRDGGTTWYGVLSVDAAA